MLTGMGIRSDVFLASFRSLPTVFQQGASGHQAKSCKAMFNVWWKHRLINGTCSCRILISIFVLSCCIKNNVCFCRTETLQILPMDLFPWAQFASEEEPLRHWCDKFDRDILAGGRWSWMTPKPFVGTPQRKSHQVGKTAGPLPRCASRYHDLTCPAFWLADSCRTARTWGWKRLIIWQHRCPEAHDTLNGCPTTAGSAFLQNQSYCQWPQIFPGLRCCERGQNVILRFHLTGLVGRGQTHRKLQVMVWKMFESFGWKFKTWKPTFHRNAFGSLFLTISKIKSKHSVRIFVPRNGSDLLGEVNVHWKWPQDRACCDTHL